MGMVVGVRGLTGVHGIMMGFHYDFSLPTCGNGVGEVCGEVAYCKNYCILSTRRLSCFVTCMFT